MCQSLNLSSGWPQFHVHFYDIIKENSNQFGAMPSLSLEVLKRNAVMRVPRDLESFIFHNKVDTSKYQHNQNLTNSQQSQQYIMDLIDQKF